jgi:spore coat polysaccharide biosynthesis predicted glycosyltransferase SpsG
LKRLLISLGGVDPNNITLKVLEILEGISQVKTLLIDVVVAENCPNLASLKTFCDTTKLRLTLIIGTREMAEIMARSDIAIGAGGTSSWERCVLGLPTVQLTVACNQALIGSALHNLRAVISTDLDRLGQSILKLFDDETRMRVSSCAAAVADGNGLERVYKEMTA